MKGVSHVKNSVIEWDTIVVVSAVVEIWFYFLEKFEKYK